MITGIMGGLSTLGSSVLSGLKSLPWGSIGSALGMSTLDLGSDLLGGALSYSTNKKLMAQQYEYNLALQKQAQQWQKHVYENYHSWNTSSLRNAGLNPVLSATNGASVGSTGGSVSLPHSSISLSNPLEAISMFQEIKQRAEAHEVNIAQSEANLAKTAAEVGLLQANIDNINSATASNVIENKWRLTQHWTDYRYGKELRELYPTSDMERYFSPVIRPLHSALAPFSNSDSVIKNPIVIKKGSKFTNYKYKYHNSK